jgi:hypothetical protein
VLGSIDFNGERALSLAGAVFMPADRWAYYFGMTINWNDVDGVAPLPILQHSSRP